MVVWGELAHVTPTNVAYAMCDNGVYIVRKADATAQTWGNIYWGVTQ